MRCLVIAANNSQQSAIQTLLGESIAGSSGGGKWWADFDCHPSRVHALGANPPAGISVIPYAVPAQDRDAFVSSSVSAWTAPEGLRWGSASFGTTYRNQSNIVIEGQRIDARAVVDRPVLYFDRCHNVTLRRNVFLGHGRNGVLGEGFPVIAMHECTGTVIVEGNYSLLHKGPLIRSVGGDGLSVLSNQWWSASVDHGLECVSFQAGHPWTRRETCLAYGHTWDEVGDPYQGAKGGTNNRRGYANSSQRRWIELPASGNRTYLDIADLDIISYLSPPTGHEWFLKWQGGPDGVRGVFRPEASTPSVLVVDWFLADGSPCEFAGQAALWYAIDLQWFHKGGLIDGNVGGGHPGQLGDGGSRSGGASVACYVHRSTVARRNQFTSNLDAGIHFEYSVDSIIEDNDLTGNQGGSGNQYEFVFFSKGCLGRNNRLGAGRARAVHQGCPHIRTIMQEPQSGVDQFTEATTSDTGFALARRFTHLEGIQAGAPRIQEPPMTYLGEAAYSSLLSPSDVSVINPA